jgi:hypothetical protein
MMCPDDLPALGAETDGDLPVIRLTSAEIHVELLRRLQTFVLKHPVAAKAAFAELVAEGDAYATTAEGKRWAEKLAGSELMHRARLLLDLPGLSLLERDRNRALPSGYLDAVFMLASAQKPGGMLDPLLNWSFSKNEP